MPKTPGREHALWPSLQNQSPRIPGVSFHRLQSSRQGEDRALADVDTQKSPTPPLLDQSSNRSTLADVDTQKSPNFVSGPQEKELLTANTPVQSVVAQKNPPSSNPFYPYNTSSARKRSQQMQRKKILLVVGAILLLIPFLVTLFEIVNLVSAYRQVQDGLDHLQAMENIFRGNSGAGIANYLDASKLHRAQNEIDIAHADFTSVNDRLDHDNLVPQASHLWPTQVETVRALSSMAVDGTAVAQELLKTMREIAPSIAPAVQKSSSNTEDTQPQPYITPSSYRTMNTTFDNISPLVHRMALSARRISLSSLPINSKQRTMIAAFLLLIPALDTVLAQRETLRDPLEWFLGIGEQRAFLIEPMDRAELRATGGFTGQFGQLVLNGAHIGSLKLSNIGRYEEDHTFEGSPPDKTVYPKVVGQRAPTPYSDWWPIDNFGLRDANLSADFPTSAKLAMQLYNYEFGTKVDGVIVFTPALIKHALHVTGPIPIPAYNQTITEQNLEDLLHYYQLNNTGIRQEEIVEHVDDNQVARKLFTQRVTEVLVSTVTHLSLDKMLALASEMFQAMKSKDLQIYVTNAQLESLIGKYGSTASLDRSTSHDGFFLVQSNLSASKASQYVTTTIQDTITLDNQGGAAHSLQLTLDYQQKGDVYGFDTYRDYVRLYVPENSQFLAGNGFDQYNKPYCGDQQSGYSFCEADVYGDGSLVCSLPIQIGYAAPYLNDPYAKRDHPLDVTGPPPNLQSDEVGRAMFGGWVVIPKNCTMKVTLSWYVPSIRKQSYSLLLQSQASISSPFDLVIKSSTGICSSQQGDMLHSSRILNGEDIFFTAKQQDSKCSLISQ